MGPFLCCAGLWWVVWKLNTLCKKHIVKCISGDGSGTWWWVQTFPSYLTEVETSPVSRGHTCDSLEILDTDSSETVVGKVYKVFSCSQVVAVAVTVGF